MVETIREAGPAIRHDARRGADPAKQRISCPPTAANAQITVDISRSDSQKIVRALAVCRHAGKLQGRGAGEIQTRLSFASSGQPTSNQRGRKANG